MCCMQDDIVYMSLLTTMGHRLMINLTLDLLAPTLRSTKWMWTACWPRDFPRLEHRLIADIRKKKRKGYSKNNNRCHRHMVLDHSVWHNNSWQASTCGILFFQWYDTFYFFIYLFSVCDVVVDRLRRVLGGSWHHACGYCCGYWPFCENGLRPIVYTQDPGGESDRSPSQPRPQKVRFLRVWMWGGPVVWTRGNRWGRWGDTLYTMPCTTTLIYCISCYVLRRWYIACHIMYCNSDTFNDRECIGITSEENQGCECTVIPFWNWSVRGTTYWMIRRRRTEGLFVKKIASGRSSRCKKDGHRGFVTGMT